MDYWKKFADVFISSDRIIKGLRESENQSVAKLNYYFLDIELSESDIEKFKYLKEKFTNDY